MRFVSPFLLVISFSLQALADPEKSTPDVSWDAPGAGNPILPGYYADPSVVTHAGKFYLYATLDPWGGDTLGCWESADFANWTFRELNWPTKAACTSATSKGAKVWAPSVIAGKDGRFYMYVSVGNEIWAGVAEHPLGPWRNLLGDRPMIAENFRPGFHMIDAEAFIDDDGAAYLYWGSGLNWRNGRCYVVKLKSDMVTFDGEVKEITPKNYFEAPFMVKHAGRYYLTYSQGKTTEDTYQVHYAIGNSPFGPFEEASNSPILVTDQAKNVVSPGHHAVVWQGRQPYILYHRHSIPFVPGPVLRQICLDPMPFTKDGLIDKVTPTHAGPTSGEGRHGGQRNLADPAAGARITATSQLSATHGPERALDNNYATRWMAARDARGATLELDLGGTRKITRQELRPEFAWKPLRVRVEASPDGRTWSPLANHVDEPVKGSPIVIDRPVEARYLRLVFPPTVRGGDIGLFEWAVY